MKRSETKRNGRGRDEEVASGRKCSTVQKRRGASVAEREKERFRVCGIWVNLDNNKKGKMQGRGKERFTIIKYFYPAQRMKWGREMSTTSHSYIMYE